MFINIKTLNPKPPQIIRKRKGAVAACCGQALGERLLRPAESAHPPIYSSQVLEDMCQGEVTEVRRSQEKLERGSDCPAMYHPVNNMCLLLAPRRQ